MSLPILRFLLLIGCFLGSISNHHLHNHEPLSSFRELSRIVEDDLESIPSTSNNRISNGFRSKKSVVNDVFSSELGAELHRQCKTIETTIQVSKEDKTSTGDLLRVCEGVIKVNKCEGVCLSNLRPSVNTATGLLKECICCREGVMHRKEVTLEICFDADGNRLAGQSMTVTIPEPKDCGCFRCSSGK